MATIDTEVLHQMRMMRIDLADATTPSDECAMALELMEHLINLAERGRLSNVVLLLALQTLADIQATSVRAMKLMETFAADDATASRSNGSASKAKLPAPGLGPGT